MKIGLSSYSLVRALRAGEMTIEQAIAWAAEQGAEHMEIVPIGFTLGDEEADVQPEALVAAARQSGITLSNYTVSANFAVADSIAYDAEVSRVLRQVDIAHRLGVTRMRHDVAKRPVGEATIMRFREDFEQLVTACRIIADYAAPLGIVTSLENHGYHMQASERVQALLHAVDRPNFCLTLDIGNFLCVDEEPLVAVEKLIDYASVIHLKDFYIRSSDCNPGEGWIRSASGKYLRGAIFGQGDIPVRRVLYAIKQAGFDGYVSLEFEGMEDCRRGSQIGITNAKRLWSEV